MRTIERIFRSADNTAMFFVIRDTSTRQSEVWFLPADGREVRHIRTYTHARDAAQKAASLADKLSSLTSQPAWDTAVMS